MLKLTEVYEKQVRQTCERSDGSEYVNFAKIFATRDFLINPHYIVSVHPFEFSASRDLERLEGVFPEGTQFSRVVVDGNSFRSSEIMVVGSFSKFCTTLGEGPT